MWWLSVVILLLQGCGFTCLYQHHGECEAIEIAFLPDREGQVLRNALMTLFPNSTASRYLLEAHLEFEENSLGLRRDATAKRHTLKAKVVFSLKDIKENRIIYQDQVTVNGGYNSTSTTHIGAISVLAAEKDSRTRIIKQCAQEIKLLIASYLNKER